VVGVFLTTFNFLSLTRRCLETFHRSTRYPHVLVVVDNCSTDGTLDFLRAGGYRVIANRQRVGLARALNQGTGFLLQDPRVEYICWIQNDMVFYPEWLDNLVSVHRERPEIGKLASWNLLEKPSYSDEEVQQFIARGWHFLETANGNPWIMPVQVVRAIGPHDEGYIYCGEFEDWDYNNRLLEAGYRVMVTKRSVVWHRAASTRFRIGRKEWEVHNQQRYLAKWGQLTPRATNLY